MDLIYTQEPLYLSLENRCDVPNEITPEIAPEIPLKSSDQDECHPFLNTCLSKDNLNGQNSSNQFKKLNSCHLCNMSFESVSFFEMLTHSCKKPEKQISEETSYEYNDLNNCIQSQTAAEGFECKECHKLLSTKEDWKRHLNETHGEGRFQCQISKKLFDREFHLRKHIRTYNGEKSHACEVCGKCFSRNSLLKNHMRTHTGEKPYVCDICGKCFSLNGTLKLHIFTHTGEKPYACDACEKCFRRSSDLKQHMRTHAGNKLYFCDVCGKCCRQRGILLRHMTTHTGENRYT